MENKEDQPAFSFRQATDADYDFLYQLNVATLREYVEVLWGWEESWQQEYFARKFDPHKYKIIQIAGRDAGVLVVEHQEQQLYLGLIEILPEFQGRGVGTAIITDLCNQAHECNQVLTFDVLKSNIPARRLYERLGFVVVSETEYRIKMIKKVPETAIRSDT